MTVSPLDHHHDAGSFEDFYREFYPRVLMLVARHFPDCDAEEIAQEAMTRCYAKFDELDPAREPWPWVSSIARNAAIDSYRRSTRVTATDELPEPPSPGDATYDAVLVSECRRLVRAALARLRPADRQLIEDRELAGLEYAEMAAVRDMTPNALRQSLFRARGKLAVELRRVGASLGVVPVAVQARCARLSRRLHEISNAAGPAGATALSVAAVAGVATVAGLGGPSGPVRTALPRAGEPVQAVERVTPPVAREAAAPARAVTRPRRTTPSAPAPQVAAPRPEDRALPVGLNRNGDPTKPHSPQSYSWAVYGPDGKEVVKGEYYWESLPGKGVLCYLELGPCREDREP